MQLASLTCQYKIGTPKSAEVLQLSAEKSPKALFILANLGGAELKDYLEVQSGYVDVIGIVEGLHR